MGQRIFTSPSEMIMLVGLWFCGSSYICMPLIDRSSSWYMFDGCFPNMIYLGIVVVFTVRLYRDIELISVSYDSDMALVWSTLMILMERPPN